MKKINSHFVGVTPTGHPWPVGSNDWFSELDDDGFPVWFCLYDSTVLDIETEQRTIRKEVKQGKSTPYAIVMSHILPQLDSSDSGEMKDSSPNDWEVIKKHGQTFTVLFPDYDPEFQSQLDCLLQGE